MSNLRTTMVVLAGSGALLGAFNTPAYVQAQHVPVYYDYMDNGRLRGGRILVDTADASQRSQLGLDLPGGFVAGLWPVTTIINNGPPINRVDVAILGDGYRAVEMVAYAAHVENVVSAFFAQEPLAAYATYFNVHRVDVVSNQSGVDELDLGIFRDTALDMEYGCFGISRLLCINLAKASVAAASAPGVDQILALANSTRYGGAGYPESALATLAGNNVLAVELALHEFGHAFADLADEYDYGDGATYAGGEPFEPNVSIFGAATQIALETKWYRWLDLVNVDTFEGAYYSQFGVYRPTVDSKMRSLGRPFEQVNVEQLVIGMYRIVRPIDNATPPSPVPLPPSSVLFVTPLQPVDHTLDIQWSIDGIDVTGAVENTFTPGSTPLSIGLHDITVTVADNTSWVRDAAARTDYLTDSRTWQVIATDFPPDCNGNGIPNGCDVDCDDACAAWRDLPGCGASRDCNANRVPDECESLPDCNDNGSPDTCDLASGTSDDCDDSGIPDECEGVRCRHFSTPVPGLIGTYGGIAGEWHSGEFDFGRSFYDLRFAWLDLAVVSPDNALLGAYICLKTECSEAFGSSLPDGSMTFDVPFAPDAAGGRGIMSLVLRPFGCCDLQAHVSAATLWFDAAPLPPPADLRSFAAFQVCFGDHASATVPACAIYDRDGDGRVELDDYRILQMVLVGP